MIFQNCLSFQLSTAAAAAFTLITLSTMVVLSNPLNAMQILFISTLMVVSNFAFSQILVLTRLDRSAEPVARG